MGRLVSEIPAVKFDEVSGYLIREGHGDIVPRPQNAITPAERGGI